MPARYVACAAVAVASKCMRRYRWLHCCRCVSSENSHGPAFGRAMTVSGKDQLSISALGSESVSVKYCFAGVPSRSSSYNSFFPSFDWLK